MDGRRVRSGVIFINRNGLRWCDAPVEYGPPQTRYNRWKRWSDMGVFARIMMGLAEQAPDKRPSQLMPPTHCPAIAAYSDEGDKAHRTASSLRLKRGERTPDPLPGRALREANGPRRGLTKGSMNTKLHAITDTIGRPIRFLSQQGKSAIILALPP